MRTRVFAVAFLLGLAAPATRNGTGTNHGEALAQADKTAPAKPVRSAGPAAKGGLAKKPGPRGATSKKAPPTVQIDVAALTTQLESQNLDEVRSALATIRAAGADAAPMTDAVLSLLRGGASVEILGLSLDAVAALGLGQGEAEDGQAQRTQAATVVRSYLRHRNLELRLAAARSLAKIGGAPAVAALRSALSDAEPTVRGAAASGLGGLRNHEVLPDLLAAFERNVAEAAGPIGQLCVELECEKFADRLGHFSLDVMTAGFDAILFRPQGEIADDFKIKLVRRVRELRTAEADKYLADVQSRWPENAAPRVKLAIDEAVRASSQGGAP